MRIIATLALALGLAGCGAVSSLNPFGLFGRSEEVRPDVRVAEGIEAVPSDPRPLAERITAMTVEPTRGGVIVTARALPPRQGFYEIELFPENDGRPVDGVLTYSFRAVPPPVRTREGPPVSRELVASAFVTDFTLAGTRVLRVEGAANARESRR